MSQIIENLIAAANRHKIEQQKPNLCRWCGQEITEALEYCEGTDCEYDGEKWRRLNYG